MSSLVVRLLPPRSTHFGCASGILIVSHHSNGSAPVLFPVPGLGRGPSNLADYDGDGWLDIVMSRDAFTNPRTGEETKLLMRNLGNDNHWLKLDLTGTMSNADAIGAKVRVKATIQGEEMWQLREIGTSQGWLTYQSDMRPHFGLGDATAAEVVRIEWPSGIVQELSNVNVDQILKAIEPPRLSIQPVGVSATLSWPARAEGYALYQAASPDGPWEPVNVPVVVADHQTTVEVSGGDSVRFYRLQMP